MIYSGRSFAGSSSGCSLKCSPAFFNPVAIANYIDYRIKKERQKKPIDRVVVIKNVFVDSYQQGKIDVSDLQKMGEASTSLQGAAIGHFLNEVMAVPGYGTADATTRDANFNSAHNPSLDVEGKIYGELVGDASITTRTTLQTAPPSGGYQNVIFKYNTANQFQLQQGATSKSVPGFIEIGGVKIPSTNTTFVPTGLLKSVTQIR